MINILLSVRQPFSRKILSGEKTLELRKTCLALGVENLKRYGFTNPERTESGQLSASADLLFVYC